MPRRIDLGRAVLIGGAALLLISLFTEWYDTGPTGWEVFETLDLVLAAIAVAGIVAAVRPDAVPPWVGWALPMLALAIVVVQLFNTPPAAGEADPSTGAWLALAGSLLMAAGAALSLAAISVTVQVRERELRRRVAAVDRRTERDEPAAVAADLDVDPDAGADAPDAPGRPRGSAELWSEGEDAAPGTRRATHAKPAPIRPDPDDLERTQPLSDLPDGDQGGPERP
jgi:hypothetical protein